MKTILIITILASFFSVSAFAEGQVNTDCPMMRESNRRANLKSSISKEVKKPSTTTGSKGSSV